MLNSIVIVRVIVRVNVIVNVIVDVPASCVYAETR